MPRLCALYDSLENSEYLQEVIDELNFLGHLRAALAIVQKVRFIPGEQGRFRAPPRRPSECLPHIREKLTNTIKDMGLNEPSREKVVQALEEYKLFSAVELSKFRSEISP